MQKKTRLRKIPCENTIFDYLQVSKVQLPRGSPSVAALALVCHAGFLEATPELSEIWIQEHDGDNKNSYCK